MLTCIIDPFADVGEDQPIADDVVEDKKKSSQVNNYVHIRIQQRNGRKTLTTLQGLPKGKWRGFSTDYRVRCQEAAQGVQEGICLQRHHC